MRIVTPRAAASLRALACAFGEKSSDKTSSPCSARKTPLRPSPSAIASAVARFRQQLRLRLEKRVRRRAEPIARRSRSAPASGSGFAHSASSEDGRADAHMRRAHGDGGGEIGAHAHRQQLQPVAPGDLGQSARNAAPAPRRPAECTSGRKSSGRSCRGTRSRNASASSGSTPAFCGSAPVLICDEQERPACPVSRSPWPAPRTGLRDRPNGWRRTAPPLPSPCWIAAAR